MLIIHYTLYIYYTFSIQISAESGGNDNPDGGYTEHPDEERAKDWNPDICPADLGGLGHLEGGSSDESYDARAYAAERAGYPRIVLELTEEEGYSQDDEERRQNAPQGGCQCSPGASYLVANEDGNVHGEDARAGLCHSHQVQQVLTADPLLLVHHLGLNQRNHGISAADGEEANVEEGAE